MSFHAPCAPGWMFLAPRADSLRAAEAAIAGLARWLVRRYVAAPQWVGIGLAPATECGEIAMKVFICWSGEHSKQLAAAIHTWLRDVLQAVEPYLSSVDIDKGARWYSEIVDALEKSDIGLIILTQENLANPWIMFEAGAVARSVERARVCLILFDIKKTDLRGPLSFFQATQYGQSSERGVVLEQLELKLGELLPATGSASASKK
jgi:hypothetical protein